MEAFAQEYYRQGKGQHPFVDADAAFILAFSIIMLNTDLHNPQVHCCTTVHTTTATAAMCNKLVSCTALYASRIQVVLWRLHVVYVSSVVVHHCVLCYATSALSNIAAFHKQCQLAIACCYHVMIR
jgi:Sec7 domain